MANYLSSQPDVMLFIQQIENMLGTWLPHLERNNRSYVTVGIGCTGGQHRSVFIAERLASAFRLAWQERADPPSHVGQAFKPA